MVADEIADRLGLLGNFDQWDPLSEICTRPGSARAKEQLTIITSLTDATPLCSQFEDTERDANSRDFVNPVLHRAHAKSEAGKRVSVRINSENLGNAPAAAYKWWDHE
jgi:hypothetical protein